MTLLDEAGRVDSSARPLVDITRTGAAGPPPGGDVSPRRGNSIQKPEGRGAARHSGQRYGIQGFRPTRCRPTSSLLMCYPCVTEDHVVLLDLDRDKYVGRGACSR